MYIMELQVLAEFCNISNKLELMLRNRLTGTWDKRRGHLATVVSREQDDLQMKASEITTSVQECPNTMVYSHNRMSTLVCMQIQCIVTSKSGK